MRDTGADLDPLLDDPLDDFVFEPDAWDFAVEIGIGIDPARDRAALGELPDAMLVWARGGELERLTDTAIAQIWSDELAQSVREGVVQLGLDDAWKGAAATAVESLDSDPACSEVAREVVRHLAMQLSAHDCPLVCLDCLDEAVRAVDPAERRAVAVQAAVVAATSVDVSVAELSAARADPLREPPAARLGTVGRRMRVRARLARIGELGRRSLPALAAELATIGSEPLPPCAQDDDVWAVVCAHLLRQEVRPELS